MQFFKPENYFEVRKALLHAGRDLIGEGVIVSCRPRAPKDAFEARRPANQAGDHYHSVGNLAKGEAPGERGLPNHGYRPGRKSAKGRKRLRGKLPTN